MAFPNVGSSIAMSQVNTELGYTSTSTLEMNNINMRKWFKRPSGVVFSTKSPELGSGGASWPPSGWTVDLNGNLYNNYIVHDLSSIGGTAIGIWGVFQLYYYANGYINFGGTGYNDTSYVFTNGASKYSLGVNAMSCQRMAHKIGPNNSYYKIRYEGTYNSSTGTPGSPNVVVEFTLFNTNITGGHTVVEIVTGNCANGGNNLYYDDGEYVKWINGATISANQSYVIYSNNAGTSPFLYTGAYFSSGATPSISLNDGRGKAKYTPYGSYNGSTCAGTNNHDRYNIEHDGIGGTYNRLQEVNSCDCGGTGPPAGTPTGYTDCDNGAGNYREEKYDGNCGTYFDVSINNCDHCNGQGATGVPGQQVYNSEQCDGVNRVALRYLGGGCSNQESYTVATNTCSCGGNDGHYISEILLDDCGDNDFPFSRTICLWCGCSSPYCCSYWPENTNCGGQQNIRTQLCGNELTCS